MKRRTLLATGSGAIITAAADAKSPAVPDELVDVKTDPWNQSPEMIAKRHVRFRSQDDESRQDFTRGITKFLGRESQRPETVQHLTRHAQSKGYDILDETNLTTEQAFDLLMADPSYAARLRLARSNFHLHWSNPRDAFYREYESTLAAMEATDKAGPGSLELNPQMDIPDYARWEIHTMPGGYVGDPFAGWIYDFGHIAGTDEHRAHGRSLGYAQALRLPDDRKVRRVLDIGCGMGGSTSAIKERFPNAEVWGIDVGGPMVRYAHYRAVTKNTELHFAQRNAEDTRFPDNHFDIAADLIMFHEIEPSRYPRVVKEIHRILRPGGVFHHVDIMTKGHANAPKAMTLMGKAGDWVNHRHNVEPWWPPFQETDFPALVRAAGFRLDLAGAAASYTKGSGNFPPFAAIKTV